MRHLGARRDRVRDGHGGAAVRRSHGIRVELPHSARTPRLTRRRLFRPAFERSSTDASRRTRTNGFSTLPTFALPFASCRRTERDPRRDRQGTVHAGWLAPYSWCCWQQESFSVPC